jgi:hypothetical protein
MLCLSTSIFSQVEMGTNFQIKTNLPIDSRMVIKTISQRNSLSQIYRYDGMKVYVIFDSTNYQLVGGTKNSNWKELNQSIQVSSCNSNSSVKNYTICIDSSGGHYSVYISFNNTWIKLK